jgi:phosphatidylinositol glycan class B
MLKSDRYTKLGLFTLIVGHVIAAITSFGFHHPDEHFQILEWAHYFIGLAPNASHLPWEFGAQIRPWFQPILHAFFLKIFILLGIYNPFNAAFFFRLLYGGLNIWALVALWNYFKEKYALSSKWFFLTSIIWFFPYIHVRTSSENLAGIFLSFALLALVKNTGFFRAGLLFGFAFLARYQIALGLVGLAAVLLLSDRGIRKTHWLLLLGFLIPVGLGTLLDRWGYGNWVFTPYQYFNVNLVENVSARFNPYPWYQYFIWILQLNPFI